jgi:iron complex transport system ATP-binding protein
MTSLRIESLDVRYHDRCALVDFTETVEPGEWVGVIGPNGAGKSSLLRAVAGLVGSSGRVLVDGVALGEMSAKERARHVAYVAQSPLVPDDMSVFDYVLLGRWPHVGRLGTETAHDRRVVREVIDRLMPGAFIHRLLGELSGGERQRAVLARALAQEASILLLDEPTSALDIGHQQQALELVTELRCQQRLTVVSAMHDLTLASIYSDRLVLLDAGRVVASGHPVDVLTADRLGSIFHVCVTVEVDADDGTVIVVPRRGFPVERV